MWVLLPRFTCSREIPHPFSSENGHSSSSVRRRIFVVSARGGDCGLHEGEAHYSEVGFVGLLDTRLFSMKASKSYLAFVEEFFDFQQGKLNGVAAISEPSFLHLFVNPSYCLWSYRHGQLQFRQ